MLFYLAMFASSLMLNTVDAKPPLPTPRQMDFMEMELVQFMHFVS